MKKAPVIVGALILVFLLIYAGQSDNKVSEKNKQIQRQQTEINGLKEKIENLEIQITALKKEPAIAFREAMGSNDKNAIATFAKSFPDQKELVSQAQSKIAEIEAEEKAAEAKRKTEEEADKKKQEQELKERGSSAGNGFYYKNVSFKDSYGMMDVIGEMRNESGEDWKLANFIVSVYSTSGELLGTGYINISNFNSGATKTFNGIVDADVDGQFKYNIQFENAL